MREMRQSQRYEERVYATDFKIMMSNAEAAVRVGETDRAWQIWQRARGRFPNSTLTSPVGLSVLLDLNRVDEADALMREGLHRYPATQFFYQGYCQVAQRRRDHAACLVRAEAMRKRFPGNPLGYSFAANAFRSLGKREEAKAILQRGMAVINDSINLWLDAGQLAIDAGEWTDGLAVYTKAGAVFKHIAVPLGLATCLKGLGRYEEAEEVLREAQAGYPLASAPWAEMARLAESKGDWDTAATHWATVRRRFPMEPLGYLEGRRTLRELGRQAEIEPMLADASERIFEDSELLVEYARVAHGNGDWAAAAERWALVRERFPERREGWDRGAEALVALGKNDEAAQIQSIAPH